MAKKKVKVITYGLDPERKKGVSAISIVDMPAIESEFVCLSKDGHAQRHKRKMHFAKEGEQRMLYGAAMIPDVLILRADQNTGEEYYVKFSPELIRDVAHEFMKNHLQSNVNIQHSVMLKGMTVVESWLKVGDADKSVSLGIDEPIGTWFVGMKIDDEDVYKLAKDGLLTGFSIEGDFISISEDEVEVDVDDEERFLIELEQILSQA